MPRVIVNIQISKAGVPILKRPMLSHVTMEKVGFGVLSIRRSLLFS